MLGIYRFRIWMGSQISNGLKHSGQVWPLLQCLQKAMTLFKVLEPCHIAHPELEK